MFLYGSQWVTCIQHFRILCLGGVFLAVQDVNYFVTAAKGQSKTLFYFNLIKVCIYILLLSLGGKWFGMIGLLYAMVIFSIVAYAFYSLLSSHFLSTKATKQYHNVVKSIAISLIPALICWLIIPFVDSLSNILQICIIGLIFVLIFFVLSMIFKPLPFEYLRNSSKTIINKFVKKND